MPRGKALVRILEVSDLITALMTLILLLACWNLFLHRKLTIESLRRRELAVAFRQFMIERRQQPALRF